MLNMHAYTVYTFKLQCNVEAEHVLVLFQVFRWTPEAISPFYGSIALLDIQCYSDDLSRLVSDLFEEIKKIVFAFILKNISVRVSPSGIPLNLTNSTSRRFPYTNQPNYTYVLIQNVLHYDPLNL